MRVAIQIVLIAIGLCCVKADAGNLVCAESQSPGAELLRHADVVVQGTVTAWHASGHKASILRLSDREKVPSRELSVSLEIANVLKGELPHAERARSVITFTYWEIYGPALTGPPRGIVAGHALVPLRLDGAVYRAVQDCWVPVIPLRWQTSTVPSQRPIRFEEVIADILLSVGRSEESWPINPQAVDIANDLVGGIRTSRRLQAIAESQSRVGGIACSFLCRMYGQCRCTIEQLKSGDIAEVDSLHKAIEYDRLRTKLLERDIRWKNWPGIIAKTRAASKADAIAVLRVHDSSLIRQLTKDLVK